LEKGYAFQGSLRAGKYIVAPSEGSADVGWSDVFSLAKYIRLIKQNFSVLVMQKLRYKRPKYFKDVLWVHHFL